MSDRAALARTETRSTNTCCHSVRNTVMQARLAQPADCHERREKAPFLLFIEVINEPRPGDKSASDAAPDARAAAASPRNGDQDDSERLSSHNAAGPGTHLPILMQQCLRPAWQWSSRYAA